MITVGQAAKLAGVSRQTIHKAIKDERLRAVAESRVEYRVSAAEVCKVKFSKGGRPRKLVDGEQARKARA